MQKVEAKPSFERFIQSRREVETRKTYERGIRVFTGDGQAFLELALSDPKKAEEFLIERIIEKRDTLAGSSILTALAECRSMCDFYDARLNWKKVKQVAPKGSYVALDRAPLREELRTFLDKANIRERAVCLIMASGGLRVGAFDYLRVGHFKQLESGLGTLRVYAGEKESEYTAIISSEAAKMLSAYLQARVDFAHERLTPDSFMFRNRWNYKDGSHTLIAKKFGSKAIQAEVSRLWLFTGIRTVAPNDPSDRKEFKACHGMRKFCKTQLTAAGVSWADTEVLLGHKLTYHKPTLEQLTVQYLKAEPFLTISEAEKLKADIVEQEKKHDDAWTKTRLENLEMKDQLAEIRGLLKEHGILKDRETALLKERAELTK